MRQFYCFLFQIRKRNGEIAPNIYHKSGRLLQQFAVDAYCKIHQNRLRHFFYLIHSWVRKQQSHIRAELYQGLRDAFVAGDSDASRIGRRIVLPSSITGSPRHMQQLYQDSMAIVRRFGKPDLFITMTCNSNWIEIKGICFIVFICREFT